MFQGQHPDKTVGSSCRLPNNSNQRASWGHGGHGRAFVGREQRCSETVGMKSGSLCRAFVIWGERLFFMGENMAVNLDLDPLGQAL